MDFWATLHCSDMRATLAIPGAIYEVALWDESVVMSGDDIMYAINIPQEAVTIPETIGCHPGGYGDDKRSAQSSGDNQQLSGAGKMEAINNVDIQIRTLDDLDCRGKTVLLRLDINSPLIQRPKILNLNRIKASLATIKDLLAHGLSWRLLPTRGTRWTTTI